MQFPVSNIHAISIDGMDARVLLAQARIAEGIYGIDSEQSATLLLDAVLEAGAVGRHAYAYDQTLPGLLMAEPILAHAWHDGYDASAEMDEMSHCSGCMNAAGDPCPSHG